MNCPYCQQEMIIPKEEVRNGILCCVCRNPKCEFDGWHFPVKIITELTKTKQALDVANEKLRHCANITVEALDELKGNLLIAYDALLHFSKDPIANNALKQITETKD